MATRKQSTTKVKTTRMTAAQKKAAKTEHDQNEAVILGNVDPVTHEPK